MNNSSGFYKLDENILLYGPNFVLNLNYELRKESKNNYEYPVDGWYYFDSDDEAYFFFNLDKPTIDSNNGPIPWPEYPQ